MNMTPSKIMRHKWLVKHNNIKRVNLISLINYLSVGMSENQWKLRSISSWPEEIPSFPKYHLWIMRNSADVTQSPLSLAPPITVFTVYPPSLHHLIHVSPKYNSSVFISHQNTSSQKAGPFVNYKETGTVLLGNHAPRQHLGITIII